MPTFYFKTDEFTAPDQRFKHEYEDLAPALDEAKILLLNFAKSWISASEGGAVKIQVVADDQAPLANISLSILTTTNDRR